MAADELHREEVDAVGLVHGMERDDVGVAQPGDGLRFALETRQALSVLGEVGGQYLERHLAVEPGVARTVHLAHATLAEQPDDLVVRERGLVQVGPAGREESLG